MAQERETIKARRQAIASQPIALRLTVFFITNLSPVALLIIWMARAMTHATWFGAVCLLTLTLCLTPLLLVAGNLAARKTVRFFKDTNNSKGNK